MSSDFDEYAQMMDMNTRNLQKWIDMLCKKEEKIPYQLTERTVCTDERGDRFVMDDR
ncbi:MULTISPECIES: hypothetical protein [Hafnia]|uniref:Uncharacterized protein n=2 Tax=Hafnia alvei TaxID=569 RepID=A0A377PJE6_HAFAL|nr:hypothetical protein [Hafnia alvei]KFC86954.1 hypothetical protein GHAL_2765 [Hafnia alvei ATCC 13337]MCV9376075.1 hypothetical protein [Hafnia alvei]MDX6843702.1 hypothetical protein [Hafnia alvei]WQD27213.1 hypothetical protein U0008_10245 [Hafnia alvei]STQ80242.1 Uncharacterised protein [Hafnia alvei]